MKPASSILHHISQNHGREHTIFLAPPASPLLLVFSDVMGVKHVDIARAKCLFDEFEGKVSTCCVDLYGSRLAPAQRNDRTKFIGKAFDEMNNLLADPVHLREILAESFSGIKEYAQATKVGALGFCFGGACVVEMVRHGVPLQGAVSFHGTLDAVPIKSFTGKPPPLVISKPVNNYTRNVKLLVATGAADPLVPRAMVERFEAEVSGIESLDLTVASYKGAVHAFTTFMPGKGDNVTSFNANAARQSWVSAIDLFRDTLHVPSHRPPSSKMWTNDLTFEKTAHL